MKEYKIDDVECERYMMVFGEDGTRIVDNETGKELYVVDCVTLLNDFSIKIEDLREQADLLEKRLNHWKDLYQDLHNKCGDIICRM